MTQTKADGRGEITTQVLIMAVCIAFAVGFISGVVLTVYKTSSSSMDQNGKMGGADMDKMAEALESDLVQNPDDVEKWTQLGNTYFDSAQYQKAIAAYGKSIELDPSRPGVITDMGIMYRRTGQYEKAIRVFDQAISVDPEFEMAYLNKGIVFLYDMKNETGALEAWEKLLEINPLAMVSDKQSVDSLVRHFKDKHDEEQKN